MPIVLDLLLQESDTLFVARLMDFEVSPRDGSFFLADQFAGKVLRFDRAGKPMQTYGRKGSGPGELMRAGKPLLFWDSLLGTGDRNGILTFFRLEDGHFVTDSEPLSGLVTGGGRIEDGVWIAVHNYSHGTALAVLSTPTTAARYVFPLPMETLLESRFQVISGTSVAFLDTLHLVGIPGIRTLWLTDESWAVIDSLTVPRLARRGVPEDFVGLLGEMRSNVEVVEAISLLRSLTHLPDGGVGIVYHDANVVDWQNLIVGAMVYVSVLSPDLRRACVDYAVAQATDQRPRHSWRGDTLFVATQEIVDGEGVTRIRGFRVDTTGCDWIPI